MSWRESTAAIGEHSIRSPELDFFGLFPVLIPIRNESCCLPMAFSILTQHGKCFAHHKVQKLAHERVL
jgi:hypothetical protein